MSGGRVRRTVAEHQGAAVVIGWSLYLGIHVPGLWVLAPDPLGPALLTASVAGALVLGLVAMTRPRARPEGVPALSPASVALALGVATMVLGAAFGPWLIALGGGLVLLGAGGLVREWTAARRGA